MSCFLKGDGIMETNKYKALLKAGTPINENGGKI